MKETTNFLLKIFEAKDKLDYNVFNENAQKIENALQALSSGGGGTGGSGSGLNPTNYFNKNETLNKIAEAKSELRGEFQGMLDGVGGSTTDNVDIIPKQDFTFANYDGVYGAIIENAENHLIPGETYKIVWDDVEYTCTAKGGYIAEEDMYSVTIGNHLAFGEADTGEPFGIQNTYTSDGSNCGFAIMSYVEGETHNVHIYQDNSFMTESAVRRIVDEIINDALNMEV